MRKMQSCIVIFILLVAAGVSLAQEDTWTRKADMPPPRQAATSVVNGYIYAMRGWTPIRSTVEAYDTDVGIRVRAVAPQEDLLTGKDSFGVCWKCRSDYSPTET